MLALYVAIVIFSAIWFAPTLDGMALVIALGLSSAFLMESAVQTFLLLFMVRDLLAEAGPRRWSFVAEFLIPLVRIDSGVIVAIWAGVWFLHGQRRPAIYVLLWLGLGTLTQLLIMRSMFGHWFSVSSMLKAGSARHVLENLHQNVLIGMRGRALLLFILLSYALTALPSDARLRRKLLAVVLAPTIYMAAQLSLNHDVRSWYTTAPLTIYALAGLVVSNSNRTAFARRLLPGLLAIAFVMIQVYRSLHSWSTAQASLRFVRALADAVPSTEPVLQLDGSGFVGYFSGRHIIDADGLVNDHEYAERLVSKRLAGYLSENRIRYYVTNERDVNLAQNVKRFGGMILPEGHAEILLASEAAGQPGNVFCNYRLYILHQ